MPFQQVTGCWSPPQGSLHRLSEESLGYFFHERAAADTTKMLPTDPDHRLGASSPLHPRPELHASLLLPQLHHKCPHGLPKCLYSSTAAPWPSPVRCPTTPLWCECARVSESSWKRLESSMPLSCRLSLVHEHTVEVVPSIPDADHEVSPGHSILTPLPDNPILLLGPHLPPVSFLVESSPGQICITFHYKCFETVLLTKRKINASHELDLIRY